MALFSLSPNAYKVPAGTRALGLAVRPAYIAARRKRSALHAVEGSTNAGAPADAAPSSSAATSDAEANASAKRTVTLRLRKPVGLVFAQKPEGGPVFVDEVVAGGAAEKTGQVAKGDILTKCSAVVLKAGKEGEYAEEGYGQRPYDNWETVMFDCEGQEFKVVMSALKSNNERWGIKDVTLVLREP